MAKSLSRALPTASKLTSLAATNSVNGVGYLRSLSSSGYPFLSLFHTPAQAHAHSASSHPASASTHHAYASQFLSSGHGGFLGSVLASPRHRTATATAVDATPLPTYACEKSAVDRIFQQQTVGNRERAFFVNDVGIVERQYNRWVKNLPGIRPFYAVKCNPDPTLLRTLAGFGAGFDCASGEEMAACLAMGVPPEDIIFANPIKCQKDLKYAASVGVRKMTFDNEAELVKIREFAPNSQCVLRLLADDSGSKMKFGVKFGAPTVHVEGLLKTAKALNLSVIGTSFHIGSGCMDPQAYAKAIRLCRSVFDMGAALGMPKFHFLDLGGGFPGNPVENQRNGDYPAFEEMTSVIRTNVAEHFPASMGVQVIGEPGRYMATAWSTLFVLVQGKREEPKSGVENEKRKFLYYINDGVYGSFNCIMFDHAHPEPIPAYRFMADKQSLDRTRGIKPTQKEPFLSAPAQQNVFASLFGAGVESAASAHMSARSFHTTFGRDKNCVGTFFGPTCDSMDVVATNFPCEELFVGDWLAFEHSGAYTNAAATTFNGMPKPTVHYCRSRQPSPKTN